jgi:predicted amino acid-binding ACT domain protein
MRFKLDRVHVWSGEVEDKVGGMADKLSLLAQSGSNLEYIYTRRIPNAPGKGILYVAPVSGPTQVRAAWAAGLTETHDPVVMRVEGDNEAGLAHRLTQQWAIAGINLQGLSMAVVADRFVGYVAFDTAQDANRAAQILADLGSAKALFPEAVARPRCNRLPIHLLRLPRSLRFLRGSMFPMRLPR